MVGIAVAIAGQAGEIRKSKPERQGMSSDRLQRVLAMNKRYTDAGKVPGIITAVARNGVLVHQSAAGVKGVHDQRPIAMDDLFRIYSMTKPITAVAAMQLYEQGKFQTTDPVSKFVPELKDLNVYEDGLIRPVKREMTMRQLLNHTAGFSYGFDANNPVDKMYIEAGLWGAKDLDEFVIRLAKLPLMFEPGESWQYSVAVDVTGLVVQRLSGQPFDEYLREHIFDPLDMVDTSFSVPADKLHRLLPLHGFDPETDKAVSMERVKEVFPQFPLLYENCGALCDYENVTLYSGGAGLVSTLRDYLRFAVAMRNGELDGVRILSPKTVNYMRMNHLPSIGGRSAIVDAVTRDPVPGIAWGLGFALVTNPVQQGVIGSAGEYYWGGGASTIFWIDPVEDIVVVSMMQILGGYTYRSDLHVATYQALLESNE